LLSSTKVRADKARRATQRSGEQRSSIEIYSTITSQVTVT